MSEIVVSSFNRKPHTVLTCSSKGFLYYFSFQNLFEGVTYATTKTAAVP